MSAGKDAGLLLARAVGLRDAGLLAQAFPPSDPFMLERAIARRVPRYPPSPRDGEDRAAFYRLAFGRFPGERDRGLLLALLGEDCGWRDRQKTFDACAGQVADLGLPFLRLLLGHGLYDPLLFFGLFSNHRARLGVSRLAVDWYALPWDMAHDFQAAPELHRPVCRAGLLLDWLEETVSLFCPRDLKLEADAVGLEALRRGDVAAVEHLLRGGFLTGVNAPALLRAAQDGGIRLTAELRLRILAVCGDTSLGERYGRRRGAR